VGQLEGLHGRERCSFLWVVQAKGERELQIQVCCVVEINYDLEIVNLCRNGIAKFA
jgi:hypothetical protein